MLHGYVGHGTPLVSLQGDAIVERVLPRGYHTNALSPRLAGSLRSPPLRDFNSGWLSFQLAGGNWGAHDTIVENAFLGERFVFLEKETPHWHNLQTFRHTRFNTRVELVTTGFNSHFPSSLGSTKLKLFRDPDSDNGSWVSVTAIVAHDGNVKPKDALDRLAPLFQQERPATAREGWTRIGDWLAAAVRRWSIDRATGDDVILVNWLLQRGLLDNRTAEQPAIAAQVAAYRTAEQTVLPTRTVMSVDERSASPIDYPLNIRGSYDELGEAVPRDFLSVFAGQHDVGKSPGSGRLEMAEYLASGKNPLTARVYVNRVWQWMFGAGLVTTPNDFGHLGDQPVHPQLLDALAADFVANGWSTKKLVRQLALSRTFRQSGEASELGRERDPDNRLLHHYSTRRLEAEELRDSILAASGRLDRTLFGPTIHPPRTQVVDTRWLFSGPLDGNGRRSIYIHIALMEPPKFLALFNQADPKLPIGKRDVTNVPTQSLALLNDPFVAGQADYWAGRLLEAPHASPEDRLRGMFYCLFSRDPDSEELVRWRTALRDFSGKPQATDIELMTDRSAWKHVAHALFNTKEFLFYR